MGQRKIERVRGRRCEEEAEDYTEEEEESGDVLAVINNLTIETAGTEEEAAEQMMSALEMEMEEDRGIEVKEVGDETQRALGALELLTQDTESIGTPLVDDRNGFNELSRLAMLWTVWHCWPSGTRFVFNCYRH